MNVKYTGYHLQLLRVKMSYRYDTDQCVLEDWHAPKPPGQSVGEDELTRRGQFGKDTSRRFVAGSIGCQ